MKRYLISWATEDGATSSRLQQLIPTLGHTDNWMPTLMILRHRGPAQRVRKDIERSLGVEVPLLVVEITGNLAWSASSTYAT
jgi:hypothetical protein